MSKFLGKFFSSSKSKKKSVKKAGSSAKAKKTPEKDYSKKHKDISERRQLLMHLSLKQQIFFIKQLGIIIKAGVPIFKSLNMIREQSKSRTMTKIMDQVMRDVANGQYLATALGKFKRIFGKLTINVISVGEMSGNLSKNLEYLAETLKKKQLLKRKVISASVYPIFIVIATIAMSVMLTVFVFPKIIPVFKSLSYDLPLTTRVLIFINETARSYGLLILLGLAVLIVLVLLLLRNKKIHYAYDRMLLSTPLIKNLIIVYNTDNICRTIGLLLNSGEVVVKTFQVTADATPNLVYKKKLYEMAEKIKKGEVISVQFAKCPHLFPLTVAQMISVGETTGKLSDTFLFLDSIYEEEMDDITKNLSNAIEPLLLIFMGILVGFIAISIITPIYGITQRLTPR